MRFSKIRYLIGGFCHSKFIAIMTAILLMGLFLSIGAKPAMAQQQESAFGFPNILAAGIKTHYGEYLRRTAQSFEAKDRNPERYSRWPVFLVQEGSEQNSRKNTAQINRDYDVRISETWEFLDYQLAYAQMRGTVDNAQKQKILASLAMKRLLDQSIEIYWNGLTAERYIKDVNQQQTKINKLLRDSRLSNIVNALLPHEEKQLLQIRNQIIATLRMFQEDRTRFYQFVNYRRDSAIKSLPVGIPVSYYSGQQLDQASFRVFTPFENLLEDAKEFATQDKAYSEIERLFPSVRFDVGELALTVSRRDIVRWHNYSSQLGWNLSNVFKTYPISRKGITREHARSAGMVLVARNRIALIEYQQNLANFETALLNYNNALWAQSNSSIYGPDSLEFIAAQMQKIIAAVNSSRAFGNLQHSYYRLLISGGYVTLDNINPADGERRLANLLETSIQQLLLADAIALEGRIDYSLLSQHADSPEILRLLQAWQQSLALILSTDNGVQTAQLEETLPHMQDNIQNIDGPESAPNGLVSVAESLPSYKVAPKASEEAASIAIAGTAVSRHRQTLDVAEKISVAAQRVGKAAETVGIAADKATKASVTAAEAALSANQAATRAEAASGEAVTAAGTAVKTVKTAQEIAARVVDVQEELLIEEAPHIYFPPTPADVHDSGKAAGKASKKMSRPKIIGEAEAKTVEPKMVPKEDDVIMKKPLKEPAVKTPQAKQLESAPEFDFGKFDN